MLAPADNSAPGQKDINSLRDGGFSDDEIDQYKSDTAATLRQGGFSDDDIKAHFGIKDPDMGPMKDFVDTNITHYKFANDDKGTENSNGQPKAQNNYAKTFGEAFQAGLQVSVSGLKARGKMPDMDLDPSDPSYVLDVAKSAGTFFGDVPAMAAGAVMGSPGGPVGMGAGAFALPAMARKIMMDHYQKGDLQDSKDFADRLVGTAWEGTKGAVTGAATAFAGPIAGELAGPLAKLGVEAATMTTVSKGLEGQLPDRRDFINAAITVGGLHGIGMVALKLMNIHINTGETPEQIVNEAQSNVELKQQLLSHDAEQPSQAVPTQIQDRALTPEEIEKGVPINKELVPQDLSVEKPEIDSKPDSRSPEEQEILSKIGETQEPEPKSFSEKFNSWYAKSVDWTDPLKVAYAATLEKGGEELPVSEQPHVLARLFAGHVDQLRQVLNHGLPDENGQFTGRGLNEIYKDVPNDDQAGFDAYSMAKRALELDAQGKQPWSDFNKENAQKVVDAGADKFEDLHRERVVFMNKIMDYGVKNGVIDPDIAKISKTQNAEYLPFSRIIPPDELTGDIGGTGALIKKISGSELDIKNPRVQAYQNIAAIVRRVEINDIRMKTLDNLSYATEGKDGEPGEIKNDFVREVEVGDRGLAKNQIAIFRDGKISALEGTPDVIDSLKRLEGDRTMSDMVTKLAAKFSQAVRVGTVIDPGFGFRHFFRSSLMSGVYSQTGQIPFYHPAMYLGEFMEGKSNDYKSWLYNGGAVAGMDSIEKSYIDNNLQESDEKSPFLNQAWNVIKKPIDATEAFIKMTDNLTRFTEYKRAVEQGKDSIEAAYLSREVTPDFAKVGLQRSVLRTAVAFQGAHINSLARMAQAFTEDTQGTILRMSALSGISAAMWLVNKDDQEVNDLPNYKKDLYWNFNVTRMFSNDYSNETSQNGFKTGTIFSLPKPWGPGILFGSGVERTLDAFAKHDPDAMKGYAKSLVDSVVPNIIPSIAAPILDQMANKNLFTGRQLVNNEQQKQLPEMMYQPYTSETAKQLGRLIGYVPGVRDIGPSEDPLASPAVVENYIRGWTGNAGSWTLQLADKGLKAAGVTPENVGVNSPEKPLAEYPILNEFMTRFPSMKNQPVDDFYKNLDATNKVMNTIQAAEKKGDMETALRVMSQNPDLEVKLTGINQGVSAGKKFINSVQQNPSIDPVQKRQLIDTALFQIGSMAKMGNQMMSKFKESVNAGTKQQSQPTAGGQ